MFLKYFLVILLLNKLNFILKYKSIIILKNGIISIERISIKEYNYIVFLKICKCFLAPVAHPFTVRSSSIRVGKESPVTGKSVWTVDITVECFAHESSSLVNIYSIWIIEAII